ncbi:hypothetical protein FO519_000449 [Halicephalobus sp. NKZ332]|nr:hypothetical protein FO519_000449 [Halicephalobus sp. NKZ332]
MTQFSIHYKMKTENVSKVVTFDRIHISVDELKKLIARNENINLDIFELTLTNEDTKRVYTEGIVPRNSSLIVCRLPKGNGKLPKFDAVKNVGVIQTSKLSTTNHIAEEKFSQMLETDRITHIMKVLPQSFEATTKKPTVNQNLKAGSSYRCSKCGGYGHFLSQCPMLKIRLATGIPADELIETTPDNPNAYLHVTGAYVMPRIHEEARAKRELVDHMNRQRANAATTDLDKKPEKVDIPLELICGICKSLLREAVLVPCCCESFCLDCIERHMLTQSLTERGSRCLCGASLPADSLYRNKAIQRAVLRFQKTVLGSSQYSGGSSNVLSLAAKPVPLTDTAAPSETDPKTAIFPVVQVTIDSSVDEDGPPGDENYAAKRRKLSEDFYYNSFYKRDMNEFH